jgi:alkylation response protein AidB-like acyl-CoA dehydrogenase
MRANVLRTLADNLADDEVDRGQDNIAKLVWAGWHRGLGELAMDVLGSEGLTVEAAPYEPSRWQRLFLFSRADTIYGGSDEIQRNILAERVLGLPREPKGAR